MKIVTLWLRYSGRRWRYFEVEGEDTRQLHTSPEVTHDSAFFMVPVSKKAQGKKKIFDAMRKSIVRQKKDAQQMMDRSQRRLDLLDGKTEKHSKKRKEK